jgi:hypothetical protein
MVESEAESIYERSLNEDVAFLVVGDPLWSPIFSLYFIITFFFSVPPLILILSYVPKQLVQRLR